MISLKSAETGLSSEASVGNSVVTRAQRSISVFSRSSPFLDGITFRCAAGRVALAPLPRPCGHSSMLGRFHASVVIAANERYSEQATCLKALQQLPPVLLLPRASRRCSR